MEIKNETKTFKGFVNKIDERGGVSAKDGKSWKVVVYKIEEATHDEEKNKYLQSLIFEVFGEEKINSLNLEDNHAYEVSLNFETHEYQGRWYNNIRAWKAEVVKDEQGLPIMRIAEVKKDEEPEPKQEQANGDLPF